MFEKKIRVNLRSKTRLIGLIGLDAFLLCFALWLSIALRYGDLNKEYVAFLVAVPPGFCC